jgi:ribonuclease R
MRKISHKTRSKQIEEIRREIKGLLRQNPVATFKKRQLAKMLGYTSDHEYARFKQVLRQLEQEGEIQQNGRRKFGSKMALENATGILGLGRSQNVFFTPDQPPFDNGKVHFLVSPNGLGNAKPGDRVSVKIVGGKGNVVVVKVVEVLEHEEKKIVGTIERVGSSFKLALRGKELPPVIDISRKKLNGAKDGDKVLAKLVAGTDGIYSAEVLSVFGSAGNPDVELESIVAQFGLRKNFPDDVLREAQSFQDVIPDEEIAGRIDLRDEVVFTIDPADAKDFDDAVSLKKITDDTYELGVHIADVSHYVKPGSPLDIEARKRGTSVYLTNGVIPMLPHELSDGICSLNPAVDRLAYSVIMQVSSGGKIINYRFAKSVIRSKRRFSYEEVQKIIDTGHGDFADTIIEMNKVAKTLAKLRSKAGSIDFDLPEAKFVFDEFGRPVEILKKLRFDSHRLIEEFMLLANKTVAMHIGGSRKGSKSAGTGNSERSKPFLYRVHDAPDPERIRELAVFVSHFGYNLNYDGTVNQKQLQRLLKAVEGKPEEYLINDIVLRSMAKAVYSEKNIGHYGLAFKYYTHFTSPIRRYPDLVVHRLLHAYESGDESSEIISIKNALPEICKNSSEAERRAVEAERESVKIKQAQYMMEHIGDEFEGTVAGVTNFGMFVEINDLLVEGLVHVREMDDFYTFIPGLFQLKGRRTGKVYQLGDRVKVKVVRVNMERHEIDFALS